MIIYNSVVRKGRLYSIQHPPNEDSVCTPFPKQAISFPPSSKRESRSDLKSRFAAISKDFVWPGYEYPQWMIDEGILNDDN